MSSIGFFRPQTIAQASEFLTANPGAKIFAGGTDFIVKMKNGLFPNLTHIVDIGNLGLDKIQIKAGKVIIGSGCTMTQIAENSAIKERFPVLVAAALQVGALQIINLATIGGNVGNASPAGYTIPPLFALDANVIVAQGKKSRKIKIDEFFTGPGKTLLSAGEIIQAFDIPDQTTKGVFLKLGERLAHAISKVSLTLSYWKMKSGRRAFRIALGAVAPTVVRARRAEALLEAQSYRPGEKTGCRRCSSDR